MYSVKDNRTLLLLGSPIRKPPDQSVIATPRGLSLLDASFIAYQSQGIRYVPLVA